MQRDSEWNYRDILPVADAGDIPIAKVPTYRRGNSAVDTTMGGYQSWPNGYPRMPQQYGGQASQYRGNGGYSGGGGYSGYGGSGGYGQAGSNVYNPNDYITTDPLTGAKTWIGAPYQQQWSSMYGTDVNGNITLPGRQQNLTEQQAQWQRQYELAQMAANPANAAMMQAFYGQAPWQASQPQYGGGGQPPNSDPGRPYVDYQQLAGQQGSGNQSQQSSPFGNVPTPRQGTGTWADRMNPSQQAAFGSYTNATQGKTYNDWQQERQSYMPQRAQQYGGEHMAVKPDSQWATDTTGQGQYAVDLVVINGVQYVRQDWICAHCPHRKPEPEAPENWPAP